MKTLPFITIVMPVHNEGKSIADTLHQLLGQKYPIDRFEVLVCDGKSTDNTRQIVSSIAMQDSRVQLLDNPGKRSSSGRNVGFRNGKGSIFVVVDGHCYIPSEFWLRNVAESFLYSGAECLGRPQPLDPPGTTLFQQAVSCARSSRLGHGAQSLIYGEYEGYASPVSNGAAYLREVFDCVGFVDESFDACEDVEFNCRVEQAGLRAYTSPKLAVKYYPRESLYGLFQQMIRYGIGRFRLLVKHPGTFSINTLVPALFTVTLGVAIFLSLVSTWPIHSFAVLPPILLFAPFLLYLTLILFESIRIANRDNWSFLKWLPGVFFTIHFGLGVGFLIEAARYILRRLVCKPYQPAAS